MGGGVLGSEVAEVGPKVGVLFGFMVDLGFGRGMVFWDDDSLEQQWEKLRMRSCCLSSCSLAKLMAWASEIG